LARPCTSAISGKVNEARTKIGKGAFIGSNTALVAPVKIGQGAQGAYVGSGSVVTDDVPANSLAPGRAPLVVKEGGAARLRSIKSVGKNKKEPQASDRKAA
jgi:bifunctional UDP-N-acetylglucosamine pyrophosphorylase/glucosamine-1-phosphate N-acetyltransferase